MFWKPQDQQIPLVLSTVYPNQYTKGIHVTHLVQKEDFFKIEIAVWFQTSAILHNYVSREPIWRWNLNFFFMESINTLKEATNLKKEAKKIQRHKPHLMQCVEKLQK